MTRLLHPVIGDNLHLVSTQRKNRRGLVYLLGYALRHIQRHCVQS